MEIWTAGDGTVKPGEVTLILDLQWFAAEDEGRTEEPTEFTYQKAREEGRLAKSQELIGALVLLLPALAILFLAPSMLRTSVEMLRLFLTRAAEIDTVKDRLAAGLSFLYFIRLALPIVVIAMFAGILANLIQTGFLFTTKPLVPDFSRIIPHIGRYFQRTLFSAAGIFNFFKSIVKMAIIGGVAFLLIRLDIEKLANLQKADLWLGITTIASLASRMLIISALLLLVLSIPDYMFQRWQFRESLKMTIQQAKEERKQYEGDPYVRSRLRQRMRDILTRDMLRKVIPRADVVITNPTHYAVALEYHIGQWEAPVVTAKGEDNLALMIKRVAAQHEVPIVENKILARSLYAEAEIGDYIPEAYYKVVASILSTVMNINEERRKRKEADRGA
ncbi:MAG: flagellar biosynthesis protein FlhB [Treponema sp.]|nr:flagellar biosynthesis protein FlhB [Treponema sp.]